MTLKRNTKNSLFLETCLYICGEDVLKCSLSKTWKLTCGAVLHFFSVFMDCFTNLHILKPEITEYVYI